MLTLPLCLNQGHPNYLRQVPVLAIKKTNIGKHESKYCGGHTILDCQDPEKHPRTILFHVRKLVAQKF